MRRYWHCTVVLAAIAAFAAPALAATKSVKVADDYYVRDGGVPIVTVKVNDTVRWTFVGRSAHTVTVKSGPVKFASKAMTSGTYRRKVTRSGTYRIFCEIHGAAAQSMVLKVNR